MVCGLCHREEQDHTLSTSGPTRCKYESHRENCPGGHYTACKDHIEMIEKRKNSAEKSSIEPKHDEVDKLG